MTPEQRARADDLLNRLNEFCYDYEHGLPIYDDGKMAQMRDIVEDWLRAIDQQSVGG